ncbi:hypothetical protein [Sandaracinus amylolyticus]|uniref:hypothetical protein n=1 Tax=Sandaracinus amylolyticus TaxID=927083 RepID=UPI001F42727D|nr:hypothetical protein [Sandaracinus amylolyticus]UJR83626.1 Hypothetical protein I5071_56940 [Sandaracinus amylolyticus]
MDIIEHLSGRARAGIAAMAIAIGALALPATGALIAPSTAHAVVGRPLTPVSYAGVARRTSRRTARRTVAYTTAAMTTLPAGCVAAGAYYNCGAVRYQQAYDGGNVVYVEVD